MEPDLLIQGLFTAILSAIIFVLARKYNLVSKTYFLILLISVIVLYVPALIYIYDSLPNLRLKVLYFANLFLLSIISFIIGFERQNEDIGEKFSFRANNDISYIVAGASLKVVLVLFVSKLTTSKVILALYFVMSDISDLLFWGGVGILFFNRKHIVGFKFFMLIAMVGLYMSPNLILAMQGEEYSRFSLMIPVLVLFLYFYQSSPYKLYMLIGMVSLTIYFAVFSGSLNRGDFLIVIYAINIIEAVGDGTSEFKPLMIFYNLGFYMIPDGLWAGMKPKIFNPNGQYALDIMGWSYEEAKNYSFGLGITGVGDAYWNLGIVGVVLFFFLAGTYLGFLKRISHVYNSSFFYGIYIHQMALLFLLYRLDFSFYFGRFIVIFPLIYLFYRKLKL